VADVRVDCFLGAGARGAGGQMSGSSSKHQLPESLDTGRVIAFCALIISLQRAVVTETRHGPGMTGNGLWIVGTDLHIGELTKSAVAPVYISHQ